MELVYCRQEKDNAIKQAVEEAVQLERDRTKQTVTEERVSNYHSVTGLAGFLTADI